MCKIILRILIKKKEKEKKKERKKRFLNELLKTVHEKYLTEKS